MWKSQTIQMAFIALVAFSSAFPAEVVKSKTSKSKLLGPKEEVGPYPPAGIRPDIPFNLPTDEKLIAPVNYYLPPLAEPAKFNVAPSQVYGPPALTYGPPEDTTTNETEEITTMTPILPESDVEDKPPTGEELNGAEASSNPEIVQRNDENIDPEQDDSEIKDKEEDEEEESHARIVLVKGRNKNPIGLRSAKLQVTPLRRKATAVEPIYLIDGPLFAFNGQLYRL